MIEGLEFARQRKKSWSKINFVVDMLGLCSYWRSFIDRTDAAVIFIVSQKQ